MEILENKDEWAAGFKSGWLAHLKKTGQIDWRLYQHPRNSTAPENPGIDLKQSRLMLVTSSGAYINNLQEPFDAKDPLGDYSIRLLPTEIAYEKISYAHEHYDHAFIDKDPQVGLPLTLLSTMVLTGKIGMLASTVISFMGYQPDSAKVVDELVPEVVRIAKEHFVDAVLLAPI